MHSNLLHFEWRGKKDESPALFLHGFMGSTADWQTVFEKIGKYFHCLAVDLPGHGKTKVLPGRYSYSMPATAEHVLNILDRERVKKCTLVGYSMGGRLALYLALHFPHRFNRLVLESASPGLTSEADRLARRKRDEMLALKLEHLPFNEFLQKWYDQPLFESLKRHPRFQNIFSLRLQNDPRGLANSLRFMGSGAQPSLWEKLGTLQTPTLILAGGLDKKFIDIGSRMKEKIENAQLKIIKNCGHNIHFENPENYSLEILTMES